ncbi:MAG TPA: alpha-glucan family phosphorylase [Rubrivivax sp.]|nr:alpha-glucan family phosphorylase [Rubrivivax sp.]
MDAGLRDIENAVSDLASTLPAPLQPLARVAYDYRWCWSGDGAAVFRAVDAAHWARTGGNPLRLLTEAPRKAIERAAADAALCERIAALAAQLQAERTRAPAGDAQAPVAFVCAEFGIHASLPIYSGGLGVLAGDILKQASDLALPMVGVGLLYRNGYFHQRIDASGMQHEYWIDAAADRLPCARLSGPDGQPLTLRVPVNDEELIVQAWRVDVGRIPLFLLDTDVAGNSEIGRWTTARLYESNRAIRLAQYAVLGIGAVRLLAALGIEPSVYHLNEGHPALGVFELFARERARGLGEDEAWRRVRERVIFTTHTPVRAGNESYTRELVLTMLGRIADASGLAGGREAFLALGRVDPGDTAQPSGMTPLALRTSRAANAVSRRHGQVARAMWQPLFPGRAVEGVPIGHVTNGVHVPSWLCAPMRRVLDRHLGAGWLARADRAETWLPVAGIPAAELWAARAEARSELVEMIRRRSIGDRLRRGDPLTYASAGAHGFDPERLTIGFARRLATYKRLHLVGLMPERALGLLSGERALQFVFAGKAHPDDGPGKETVQRLFELKRSPIVAGRAAFLEDYDIELAAQLVGGCDVWVNVPRPPLEASGTSGMKSALCGGLQLSVLDGWWAEGYDGSNGWAVDGSVDGDHGAQDWRDAGALFDLLEREIVPMFHERDSDGIPQRWVAMMRRSLTSNGARFNAARMVRQYAREYYGIGC